MESIEYSIMSESSQRAVCELTALMKQLTDSVDPLTVEVLDMIIASQTALFVAKDNGRIIGTLSLSVVCKPTKTKAWIDDVVVDRSYRGQGIAGQLLKLAIQRAKELKCRSIDLTSMQKHDSAWTLYRAQGFVERDTKVFRLDL